MPNLAKFTSRPKFAGQDDSRRRMLGILLSRFRRQAHLSQSAVALTLGYQRQFHISHIENAKRILDPIELENFAQLYGKSLNDFATWQSTEPSTAKLRAWAALNQEKALKAQRRYYKKKARSVSDSIGSAQQ